MSDPGETHRSPLLWACDTGGVVTVHGEVDIASCDLFDAIVKTAVEHADGRGGSGMHHEAHLDLTGVRFIDVAGTRVLVTAATAQHHDLELVVHHPPAMLVRILQLGWGHVSRLRFEQAPAATPPRHLRRRPGTSPTEAASSERNARQLRRAGRLARSRRQGRAWPGRQRPNACPR